MTAQWVLVKAGQGAERHTMYHSCKAHHPSGLRLAVSPRGGVWRYSVYDMTQGSESGGLLVGEGLATTWMSARRSAASKALHIWNQAKRTTRREAAVTGSRDGEG